MSDSYDFLVKKTHCKWDKLAIYLHMRSLCGWATIGAHDTEWFTIIMEDRCCISLDVWGDTGGGFEHVTIQAHQRVEDFPKVKYRSKFKFFFAAHWTNEQKKFLIYLDQMAKKHGGTIEELRDRYFSHDDNVSIEDSAVNTCNRGGPLKGKYHEVVGHIFNCDLTKVDLSPLRDRDGYITTMTIESAARGNAARSVADRMDMWRALLVFFVLSIHYSMDMSC